MFGGFDGQRCLNDVYVLEMERLTWSYININSAPPEARMRHSATAIGNYMIISGGMTTTGKGDRKGLYDTLVGFRRHLSAAWASLPSFSRGNQMLNYIAFCAKVHLWPTLLITPSCLVSGAGHERAILGCS